MSIRSRVMQRGDPNESEWPSQFGTGARKFKRKKKLRLLVNAPAVLSDELPDTKSPITGRIYNSKSQLRREYKQYGYEEIGNDYENEDRCQQREAQYQREQETRTDAKIKQNLIDRAFHGKR